MNGNLDRTGGESGSSRGSTGADPRLLTARRFVAALDACDFERAAELIDPDCRYDVGHHALVGPEAIIESYRENDRWARTQLDELTYQSQLQRRDEESFDVLFTDRSRMKGVSHTYRCRQEFSVGSGGKIKSIRHVELPGEREKLEAFFDRVGFRQHQSDESVSDEGEAAS